MRIDYRLWSDTQKPIAGKMILRPETTEEEQALRLFREHVGSPQRGRKFEIIFKRRVVGPREMTGVLQGVTQRAAGHSDKPS